MYDFSKIFKGNVELKELYINRIIDLFAISLIGIFIPIYLLKMSFTLPEVFVYLIFLWGTAWIMIFFAAHISSKIGIKRTIVLRVPILISFLFLLTNLEFLHPAFLYAAAILAGTSTAFYWTPLNSEFCKNADSKKVGSQSSYLSAIPNIFVIFAPILGGIMLEYFGFHSVLILVMLLTAISVIPLSFTGECLINFNYNIRKEKPLKRAKEFSNRFFIQGVFWIVEGVVWPIYIFMVLGDLVSVGIAGTLNVLGIAIFTVFIGRMSDKVDKNNIIKIGSVIFAVVWFTRIFASSPMEIFLLSLLGGLSLALIDVPIFAMFSKLSKRNPLSMVVSREVRLQTGRLTLLFILLLIALFLTTNIFTFAFAFAGIMALALLVV
ncbi:MAG: MFS transporter [Nanoarchaeota archaeon]